ncbi:Protein of unknown function [Bacillus cytotoxicus]|uniref:Uncharacterized protein n=1 Tax=Bacillus cytotoxicus TaxID=580165 RepID=A0AAX2CDP9_9BACI|nr:Protein of unknown function [Bacillus cytotoxicus]
MEMTKQDEKLQKILEVLE